MGEDMLETLISALDEYVSFTHYGHDGTVKSCDQCIANRTLKLFYRLVTLVSSEAGSNTEDEEE